MPFQVVPKICPSRNRRRDIGEPHAVRLRVLISLAARFETFRAVNVSSSVLQPKSRRTYVHRSEKRHL